MNYPNFKKTSSGNLVKNLTAFVVLSLAIASIFFPRNAITQSLPDCSTVTGTVRPGNNCLFYGLSLCQNIPGAGYNIPASSIVSSTPKHRENCADLSDMPLCDQMDGAASPVKNCVKQCNDASFNGLTGVRGEDYAVHNRDCVRFCNPAAGEEEPGIVDNPGVNCISRRCHQVAAGVTPSAPANCEMFKCNMLTPDELNEVKFDDSSKKYCEGTGVKCFNFTEAQLPYVKMRSSNTMCTIHNCRTTSETCVPYVYTNYPCSGTTLNSECDATIVDSSGATVPNSCVNNFCKKRTPDDVQKILDKGTSFVNTYKTYINAGYDITSNSICKYVICRPVVNRQFRCLPLSDPTPVCLNRSDNAAGCPQAADNNCDKFNPDGTPAACVNGYCTKRIDCNIPSNDVEPECAPSSVGTSAGTLDDKSVNSWFYRPKPRGEAVDANGLLIEMNYRPGEGNEIDRLCYSTDQMEDVHGWGNHDLFGGWWHWYQRSPGQCDTEDLGHTGMSYVYLCGNSGLLYNMPSRQTAYHRGFVKTDYIEGDATHQVEICLRFNNSMDPQDSCGKRQCMVVCGSIFGCSQHCGFDRCHTLTVRDSAPKDCEIGNVFTGNPSRDCLEQVDSTIRVRAVKYKDYICTFLDFKGTLAYNPQYYNGSEKMSDGTCFSGTNVEGSCAGSKNTNDSEGQADVWRTLFQIPYVENNRPAGTPQDARGYLDYNGRLFKEYECMKVPYRVHIPRTYNLANLTNSPNLFTPPLYILNSRLMRGEDVSVGTAAEPLGPTDFNYPEVEVRFGATTQKLSLGINYTGYEAGGDPASKATMTTTINGFDYVVEVFVRKEEFSDPNNPQFCLYRRVKDSDGAYLDPQRIKCVKRNLPEISKVLSAPLVGKRQVLVSASSGNTFLSSKLSLKYLSSNNTTATDCSSSGATCTSLLELTNTQQEVPTCDTSLESHQICVQREECTKLNIECMKNEVDMYAAMNSGQSIDSFLATRQNCNEILLPLCNSKKGISTSAGSNIINVNPNAPTVTPHAYGWYNELCIVTGFNNKLKNVIAYDLNDNVKGKCRIDPTSPYLNDGNSTTNCDNGGMAPNCLCIEAVDGVDPGAGYEVRKQTPREAGLCIDMPYPELCPAISYTISSANPGDPDFVGSSLNQIVYGTSNSDINNKVHISHKYRTEGKPAPDPIILRGHAEFPTSVIGTVDVNGECKGFWTYQRSISGTMLYPKLTCQNISGNASWETDARNACVRYQCNQIFTAGPDVNGFYQGNYGLIEDGEAKGTSHGFALWPNFTKTNDFPENVTATSCITGFKRVGSLATTTSGTVSGSNAVTASLYDLITGYSGGTLPVRQCNQIGQWLAPTNVCQRISCPTVTPPTPSSSSDNAAWELWRNSGGATFPSVNASRSSQRIQSESISTGTCNTDLGFFTNPGGHSPTRECDYLGNWKTVINPCVTTCNPITVDADARNFNNGFATWDQASGSFTSLAGLPGVFTGCVTGYVTNPYPPRYDINNNLLPDEANLSRPAENPKRLCKTGTTSSGSSASVWGAVINGCINQCPGSDVDPRIGVGITSHETVVSGPININWPSTPLNQDAYVSNWNNPNTFNASFFLQGRTNGNYLLKRHCNANGQWSNVEVMCSANNGQINNANYMVQDSTKTGGYQNSIAVGSTITGTCASANYWKSNYDSGALPKMLCKYDTSGSNANKIDKVYLELTDGTSDCEQRRCPARSAIKTTRSTIPAVAYNDSSTVQGQQVPGTCLNNTTNVNGSMVYTSLATGTSAPFVTCGPNGVWSDSGGAGVTNDANCKHGCDYGGSGYYDYVDVDIDDCGGDGMEYGVQSFSMQHGAVVNISGYNVCGGWCAALHVVVYCDDGSASEKYKNVQTDARPCRLYNYNPATNTVGYTQPYDGSKGDVINFNGALSSYGTGNRCSATWGKYYKNKKGEDVSICVSSYE